MAILLTQLRDSRISVSSGAGSRLLRKGRQQSPEGAGLIGGGGWRKAFNTTTHHGGSLAMETQKINYDSLRLYYAGIGAGHNQHSRFRRYPGTGERTLLKEYTDSLHLLQPNRPYKITIVFKTETTQLLVDGKVWFSYADPKPLPAGYFGLRSTKSRQWMDDVKIGGIE